MLHTAFAVVAVGKKAASIALEIGRNSRILLDLGIDTPGQKADQ